MKITQLDLRYTANKRWGYRYSVTFRSRDWRKYFAFKSRAHDMFGPSVDIGRRFLWRDDVSTLKTSTWAYKYVKSTVDSNVYFRTEDDMNQVVMMFALTYAE
jgi:hypothetical protein